MSQWRDIASAPRDGTPVLIFQPDAMFGGTPRNHHMPKGALREDEYTYRTNDPRLVWYDDRRFAIGYWRPWGGWGNRNSATVTPTHWQPLPEPPESQPSAFSDSATEAMK